MAGTATHRFGAKAATVAPVAYKRVPSVTSGCICVRPRIRGINKTPRIAPVPIAASSSVKVAALACSALRTLADVVPGGDACAGAGAIGAVVGALRLHGRDAGVVEQACAALRNIGWSRTAHRAAIVGAGAVPLLVAAHGAHGGNANRRAQEALEKLGFSSSGQERQRREGKPRGGGGGSGGSVGGGSTVQSLRGSQ